MEKRGVGEIKERKKVDEGRIKVHEKFPYLGEAGTGEVGGGEKESRGVG